MVEVKMVDVKPATKNTGTFIGALTGAGADRTRDANPDALKTGRGEGGRGRTNKTKWGHNSANDVPLRRMAYHCENDETTGPNTTSVLARG